MPPSFAAASCTTITFASSGVRGSSIVTAWVPDKQHAISVTDEVQPGPYRPPHPVNIDIRLPRPKPSKLVLTYLEGCDSSLSLLLRWNLCRYATSSVICSCKIAPHWDQPITGRTVTDNTTNIVQICNSSTHRFLSGVIGRCLSGVLSRRRSGVLLRSTLWCRSEECGASTAARSRDPSLSWFDRTRSESLVPSAGRERDDLLKTRTWQNTLLLLR